VYADEAGYAAARGAVERLLAGRKALRTFGPAELPRPDANGSIPIRLKSSLDPSRESVLIDETEPRLFGRRKRNEHLDGISLIKRMGDARRFVSTARVAVDPFIRRAQENSVAKPQLAQLRQLAQEMKNERNDAVEEFKADPASGLHHYAPFPFDTELFFDDDARRVLREISPDDPTMDQARKFIRLVGELTKAVGFPPTPYFVVLVADGDHMGRAIGKLTSIEGHIGFSEAVARFATEAEGIVAEHHGVVVYAGGDDVLAFLPVDSALDCAESLRTAFTREVATALPSEVERPTLSVGLSIGHYREPLDNLLTWGRAAERVAKEKGRNRLAVALHTASGGSDATVAHRSWDDDPVAKRWKKWTGWYAHDVLPDGFAYELRDLVRDLRAQPEELAARLLAPEAARILDRKWSAHGRVRVRDEEGGALRREMLDLIGSSLDAVEQSVDEMLIARRLVAAIGADRPRATDVAAATPAEGGSPS
jgi:CRISPR-associated protein Cmr2